ncbi:MAG TPA: serine--tRNA ligase [Candidatus Mcinerneyibacterium sp.]|nr:serine--tRNA ligase [Candidatus Mcinerneyibacterium sp.]
MIDINKLKENKEEYVNLLKKRNSDYEEEFNKILKFDDKKRELITENNKLKHEKNEKSKLIGKFKREGKNEKADEIIDKMSSMNKNISDNDKKIKDLEKKINNILYYIPNIPDKDVPSGDKSNNEVLHVKGEKPVFDFKFKDHVELADNLNLIDYERGAKLGGNGFWIYKNNGSRLEWALLNYFIDQHVKDNYEFILPPHILLNKCGFTAGQFPKFKDDVFFIADKENEEQFLLPTAETALVNLHRNEIMSEKQLPRKYFAFTPCYRKEAGSYRKEERGMIRGHQFNKIEMFQLTKPENSDNAFEEMVSKAESLVQALGLHYRLTKLAAGDVSFAMSKTYDIEVWIPSMKIYKEISSISNARSFQALRGNIRYKNSEMNENFNVHTLNGSGLATSRLLPAIIEQNQNKDGSVTIPKILRPYMQGEKRLV